MFARNGREITDIPAQHSPRVVSIRSNHLHTIIYDGLQGQNAGVEAFLVERVPPYVPLHTLCPHQAALLRYISAKYRRMLKLHNLNASYNFQKCAYSSRLDK